MFCISLSEIFRLYGYYPKFYDHYFEDIFLWFYAALRQGNFIADILFAIALWPCDRILSILVIIVLFIVTLSHFVRKNIFTKLYCLPIF